jgi:hypothetical protein
MMNERFTISSGSDVAGPLYVGDGSVDKAASMLVNSWTRRGWLVGAGALAGCASAPGPLPDYVFSLTAWTGRDGGVDLLLLNVADTPIRVINPLPQAIAVAVTDDTGASLTGGFVPLFEKAPPPDLNPAHARRLPSQKAAKGSIQAGQLIAALSGRVSLDPARTYRFGFEVQAPVVGPGEQVLSAHVRTRSLCDLSFPAGRPRMDCRSPY